MNKYITAALFATSILLSPNIPANEAIRNDFTVKVIKGDTFNVEATQKRKFLYVVARNYWRFPECNQTGKPEFDKGERLVVAANSFRENGFTLEQFADYDCDGMLDDYSALPVNLEKSMKALDDEELNSIYQKYKHEIFNLFDKDELREWLGE